MKGGREDHPKIESLWGGAGVPNVLLKREDKHEKGGGVDEAMEGCHFLLLYSSIIFILCVAKVKFLLLLFGSSVSYLAMEDSHPSLYSTKTLCHLYILIHSGGVQKMLTALFKLV